MKKQSKRLTLHRETLRALDRDRLSGIAGGDPNTNEVMTTCACTCSCNCNPGTVSCGGGCGPDTAGCPGNTNEILSGCATNC